MYYRISWAYRVTSRLSPQRHWSQCHVWNQYKFHTVMLNVNQLSHPGILCTFHGAVGPQKTGSTTAVRGLRPYRTACRLSPQRHRNVHSCLSEMFQELQMSLRCLFLPPGKADNNGTVCMYKQYQYSYPFSWFWESHSVETYVIHFEILSTYIVSVYVKRSVIWTFGYVNFFLSNRLYSSSLHVKEGSRYGTGTVRYA